MTTILPTATTSRRAMPMVMRMLLAVLATVLLGIGFSLAGVPSAANANPCNYGKQVYCDGADEPDWQWDGVDDVECVGIPGVVFNGDGSADYSGVVGQVYYFSGGGYSLVHDSGAVAAPAPAAPAPAAPAAPAPAAPAESTTTDPAAAAATTATSAPTATATPTAKPTSKPTASATKSPTITGGVSGTDAGSTSAAGDAGNGSGSAAIWLLGGLAVAAGAALGGYTVIRRRRGALASAAASASTTEPTP